MNIDNTLKTPTTDSMGVSTRQVKIEQNFGVEEDTVHFGLWVNWHLDKDFKFWTDLQKAQESARKNDDDEIYRDEEVWARKETMRQEWLGDWYQSEKESCKRRRVGQDICFRGLWFSVSPLGIGRKFGRAYFDYVIRGHGITIAFRNKSVYVDKKYRQKPVGEYDYTMVEDTDYTDKKITELSGCPNVWVELGSNILNEIGLDLAYGIILKLIGSQGGEILKTVLSRVDIKLDIVGVDTDATVRKCIDNHIVSRARNKNLWRDPGESESIYKRGHKYTSFNCGGKIHLRIYDKITELIQKRQEEKIAFYAERYGGKLPEKMMRVEYQLRREAIKTLDVNEYGRINTVEDWLRCKRQVWGYLCTKWFRITEKEVDAKNRHQDRAENWEIWDEITRRVEPGDKVVFYDDDCQRKKRKTRDVDIRTSIRQCIGLGMRCAIMVGETVKSVKDLAVFLYKKFVNENVSDRTYFKKAVNRYSREREERQANLAVMSKYGYVPF